MARSRNTADTQTASGGPVPPTTIGKNKIINGAMEIDQRNSGSSTSAIGYNLDRWSYYSNLSSKLSFQRVTDAPTGFSNSLKVTSSAATTPASGDRFILSQSVEGYNVTDLMWGTSSAKAITLSFWVKSSLTGTFVVSFNDVSGSISYVTTYTVSAANTWEYKTINITGPTTGTWNAGTTSAGLLLNFNMGTGSSLQTSTLNSWQSAFYESTSTGTKLVSTNGATWQVTGVQIEAGLIATPFSRAGGTIQGELAACQRYYWRAFTSTGTSAPIGPGHYYNSTQAWATVKFPVTLRGTPTLDSSTGSNYYQWVINNAAQYATSVGLNDVGVDSCTIRNTSMTGLSGGQAGTFFVNASGAYLGFSAEL